MPIRKITPQPAPGTVDVQCFSCSKVVTLPLNTLTLGTMTSPNVVAFPTCTCGAVEFCQRNFDAMPEKGLGSLSDRHRRAANRLTLMLKQAGRVDPQWAAQVAAETVDPPDLVDADKCDLAAFLPPPKQE
jgi:hypothetical protein